jgi:hypothetical protein
MNESDGLADGLIIAKRFLALLESGDLNPTDLKGVDRATDKIVDEVVADQEYDLPYVYDMRKALHEWLSIGIRLHSVKRQRTVLHVPHFAIVALWRGEVLPEYEDDRMRGDTTWQRAEVVKGAGSARKRAEALEVELNDAADNRGHSRGWKVHYLDRLPPVPPPLRPVAPHARG